MQGYTAVVMILNFVVNGLLLLGTNSLCGVSVCLFRCILGASVCGIYSGLCLVPQLHFLGNPFWHTVSLIIVVLLAYGIHKTTWRRGALFAVLYLALNGLAHDIGDGGVVSMLLAFAGLCVLCLMGFRIQIGDNTYVPVEIMQGDTCLQLTALKDTGNMLQDPVTGTPVLVIGAEAAGKLTGLTKEQLGKPVETMGAIPGLRLIPYKSIGKDNGLMLALKFANVKIGNWQGSRLVAFAPEGLGKEGMFEALTGGMV